MRQSICFEQTPMLSATHRLARSICNTDADTSISSEAAYAFRNAYAFAYALAHRAASLLILVSASVMLSTLNKVSTLSNALYSQQSVRACGLATRSYKRIA
jgi:hypothetical protein